MSDKQKRKGNQYLEYLRGLEPDSPEYQLEAEKLDYMLAQDSRLDFEDMLKKDRVRKRTEPQRRRRHSRQQAFNEVYICHVREAGNDEGMWSLFEYVAENEKQAKSGDVSFPSKLDPYRLWVFDPDTDTEKPEILSKSEFYRLLENARRSRHVKRMLGIS